MDLNADVGEGFDDEALFPFLTSVNVACGGHAGNESSMEATLGAAARHDLRLGAHPSFEDRPNFGRIDLDLAPEAVELQVRLQIQRLRAIALDLHLSLSHVKPHGALYNRAARDFETARAVAWATAGVSRELALVGLPDSAVAAAARESGIRFLPEGFADRRYLHDGSLSPRSREGSVIRDPAEAAAQAVALCQGLPIATMDGGTVRIHPATICIHSDSPGASAIAEAVHSAMAARGFLGPLPAPQ